MTDFRTTIPDNVGPKLYERQIRVSSTFMRAAPHENADCHTEVLFGEGFDVYEDTEDWACGQLRPSFSTSLHEEHYAGYIGWIHKSALGDGREATTHIITALRAPVFTAPDIKSPVIKTLHLNACIIARPCDETFLQIDGIGYVHKAHISTAPLTGKAVAGASALNNFVTIAEAHLGLPYIWGGISTDGLDCSGLVRSSLRAIGLDGPRDADQQQAELGNLIDRYFKVLERGDLVFWKGHVGIMQDDTHFIHANATHMCVKSEPLSEAVNRIRPQSGEITAIKRLSM